MAAALHRIDLMLDEAEARRAVGEGGAEDRHVMLIGELHEAVFLLAVLRQPLAHFADERARGIGAGLQALGDLENGVVAILKRSEERRVGKECGSTVRIRWWPYH